MSADQEIFLKVEGNNNRHSSLDKINYFCEIEKVSGWLNPTTAHLISYLLDCQNKRGLKGDVMEIGIHHGRLFILVALCTKEGERSVGVDLFDMQHLNIDKSGEGDANILLENLKRYVPSGYIELIKGDSVVLADYLIKDFKGMRFISVDGGHTRSITCSDLFVAENVAVEGAIISLDDIYRIEWSGVTAGLAEYFTKGGTLVPFSLSPNKVHFTTSIKWANEYKKMLKNNFSDIEVFAEFFNYDEVMIIPESHKWETKNWLSSNLPAYSNLLKNYDELKAIADNLWIEKTRLIELQKNI